MKHSASNLINLPNQVTFARLLLIPLIVIAFYTIEQWGSWIAAVLFLIGGSTDWLDGYLARKYQQVTPFGAFLDPVADKLLVTVALIILVEHYASLSVALAAIVIIAREIVISALREWLAQLGQRDVLAVSAFGKTKTVIQIAAITVMMAIQPDYPQWMWLGAHIVLWLAVLASIWSLFLYIKSAWFVLMGRMDK